MPSASIYRSKKVIWSRFFSAFLIELSKRWVMIVRELMLELLTYEPFGKFLPEEEEYIREILSGNDNPPPSLAKFHELFLGFYNYYVQNIQNGQKGQNVNFKNVSWLQRWKNTYHKNKNYTNSSKSGRVYYPLLFKKICFYIIVRGKEMLVVNFNCLPTIPLHDSAVVLPFDLFLQCADAGMDYKDIVKRAIAWRKDNIEKNYAGKVSV